MEKRVGTVTVFVTDRSCSQQINAILSEYASIIVARQGLPFQGKSVSVISLIVEGHLDNLNSLSGRLGRIFGVESKLILSKSA